METQDWYSVNEFAPGSYQITEGGRFNMLLLVGDDKAVAIDGGIGIANLRKLYESITDKPIDFILTHTHWDHVGAASQWEKVGVHPVGETLLANDLSKLEQGFLNMWKNNGNTFPEWFDEAAYTIKPATFGWTLEEGDTFDLGNRKFHVYETPGHSPCSISLYDEREKILVSGDLIRCEEYLFLQVPHGGALRLRAIAAQARESRRGERGALDHLGPHRTLPGFFHHRRVGAEHGGSRSGQVRPARQGGRRRVGRGG